MIKIPDVLELVAIAVRDPDPEVRANLCRSLGESKIAGAPPVLESLFQDQDPVVRKSALEALCHFPQGDSGLNVFLEALRDGDPSVREASIFALERFGNPSAIGEIEKLEQKDPEPHVRRSAKRALSSLKGP
jgi:HEAT repeat protein